MADWQNGRTINDIPLLPVCQLRAANVLGRCFASDPARIARHDRCFCAAVMVYGLGPIFWPRVVDQPAQTPAESTARDDVFSGVLTRGSRGGWQQAQTVIDAIAGRSSLGALSDPERRRFLDLALDRWLAKGPYVNPPTNYAGLEALSRAAESDAPLARLVAPALARAAIDRGDAPFQRAQAAALATQAMRAAGAVESRRQLLEQLGPEGSAKLVAAIGPALDRRVDGGSVAYGSSPSLDRRVASLADIAEAASEPPPSAASRAALEKILSSVTHEALDPRFPGDLAGALSQAVALHSGRDAELMRDVLSGEKGREMLFSPQIPEAQRRDGLKLLLSHPEWDAASIADQGWAAPDLAKAYAAPRAQKYATLRGDEPRALSGADLENTVSYTMSMSSGAGAVVDALRAAGGDAPLVTVLPLQYTTPQGKAVDLPLFRVQDAKTGEDRFVDNIGATYTSFESWRAENKLPPGTMVYPKNGHLSADAALDAAATPKTIDTAGERVGAMIDDAMLVGGVVAGGALLLGSGGTAAPAVLAAGNAWAVYRGGQTLYDRYDHSQTLNPVESPEARSAWLSLAAGGAGLGAPGSLGARGADLAAVSDSGYTLYSQWDDLSAAERAQLALGMGFWAAQAGRPGKRAVAPRSTKTIDGMSSAQMEAAFGAGPYGKELADLAARPGFIEYAKKNPAAAQDIYRASLNGFDPQAWFNLETFDDVARRFSSNERLVPIPGGTENYRAVSGATSEGQPALILGPPRPLDHNRAFSAHATMPDGSLQLTDIPSDSLPMRLDQIRMKDGASPDLERLALFSAHGSTEDFAGLSTSQAAKLAAQQIAQHNGAGGKIDHLLLDSCSQGTSRRWPGSDTNAKQFQRELNSELAALGHGPVEVLAAKNPGLLYGADQQTWLGTFRPAEYVPASEQRGGIDPETGQKIIIGAGFSAAGAAGGLLVWTAVSED